MAESKQLLHFVFGSELKNTGEVEFKDLSKLDFVGMYPNYAEAERLALPGQATVDNAQMRYFFGPHAPADGARQGPPSLNLWHNEAFASPGCHATSCRP